MGAPLAASNKPEKNIMSNPKYPTAEDSAAIVAKCQAAGMVATAVESDAFEAWAHSEYDMGTIRQSLATPIGDSNSRHSKHR